MGSRFKPKAIQTLVCSLAYTAIMTTGCSQGDEYKEIKRNRDALLKESPTQSENEKPLITDITISGFIIGDVKSIELSLNGQAHTFSGDEFAFPQTIPRGTSYEVTYLGNAEYQSCVINNAKGVAETPVENVQVICHAPPIELKFTDVSPLGPITAADYNSDGHTDLVLSVLSNTLHTSGANLHFLRVLWGNGTGAFENGPDLAIATPNAVWQGNSLISGQITDDTIADFAVATSAGPERFIGWEQSGPFRVFHDLSIKGLSKTFFEDINGDGFADMVGLNMEPGRVFTDFMFTAVGNNDGTFAAPIYSGAFPGGQQQNPEENGFTGELNLVVDDFDRDGLIDGVGLFQLGSAVNLALFKNLGDGTFSQAMLPFALPVDVYGNSAGKYRHILVKGDIDNDGDSDLAISSNDDFVLTAINEGGQFETLQRIYTGGTSLQMSLADINDSGRLDLISVNSAKQLTVSWGIGSARFGEVGGTYRQFLSQPLNPDSVFGEMLITPINGNEFKDVVMVEKNLAQPGFSSGSVYIFLDIGSNFANF